MSGFVGVSRFRLLPVSAVAVAAAFSVSAAEESAENSRWRLGFEQAGGRLTRAYSKTVGVDFTVAGSPGLFTESSWDRWHSRGKLAATVFSSRVKCAADAISVTALGQATGGGIPFLKVAKRYRSTPDSSALAVDYRFINAPDAMSLQPYSPAIHLSLAMTNRVVRFFWADEKGVRSRAQNVGSSFSCTNVVRGWFGAVDPAGGVGCVLTVPDGWLQGVGAWLPGVPASELRFVPVGIENGKSLSLTLELIPFKGLTSVSGAGGGFVGSLSDGECRIVSSRADRIAVHAGEAAETLVFSAPGELKSFKTRATTVRLLRDGREICRLDAKPASGDWNLPRVGPRRTPYRYEADFLCFTNFPAFNMRPWAKPLPGGPVKVSILTGRGNMPEVGMLAECFDMEYRAVGVIVDEPSPDRRRLGHPRYNYGDYFGRVVPADQEREINKMLGWGSDVILLAGVPLDALPASSVKLIRSRLAAGAGLVLVGDEDKVEPGVPGARVERLVYPACPQIGVWRMCGMTPNLMEFYPDKAPDPEYYFSLVARALVKAAGRGRELTGKGATEWTAFNVFREKTAQGRGRLPAAADLPPFTGPQTVEYTVRDSRGAVTDWGRAVLTNAPQAAIVSLSPASGFVREGDLLAVKVGVKGAVAGLTLRLRVTDANERVIGEKTVPAAVRTEETFSLANDLRSFSTRVTAELLSGGRVVSRRRSFLLTRPDPAKRKWDDYLICTGGNSETRYWLFPYIAKMYRDACISKVAGQWPFKDYLCPRYNFYTGESALAGITMQSEPPEYAKTGDKTKLVRRACVSSPAFYEKRRESFRRYFEKVLPHRGYMSFGFGDEQSMTGYEGRPIDFCFSEHCLREFRAFAKNRYGTLARLNAEYDSAFASWDAVMPFTRQEVWKTGGRHVAGWADHLEFMDDRCTNALAFCVRELSRLDGDLYFTLSGTQPPAAYSGMDWWKMMRVLTGIEGYEIGGQFDLQRSFAPDARLSPWTVGYALRGNNAVHRLWDSVFQGCHGTVCFWARSQFRPDLRPAHCQADIQKDLERLGRGVGKYFVGELRFPKRVAVYYSQASYRAAFIEERRAEHDALQERVRRLLRTTGLPFDYVSYEQLEKGRVRPSDYKALVLVDTVAMGDGEIAALKAYAGAGGAVVALNRPATRAFNCRPRVASPLAGFFCGERRLLLEPVADEVADRVRFAETFARLGFAVNPLGIVLAGRRVAGARVFPMTDRAGRSCWCVSEPGFTEGEAVFTFPTKGWIYDLVTGKAYGKTREIAAPYGKGHPHAFVLLPERSAVASLSVDGVRVSVDCGSDATAPLRVTVTRPDGTEADCYALNILARGGKAAFGIPFALSDPPGDWTVRVENRFGSDVRVCTVRREASMPRR